MNKTILIGRLVKDPELKTMESQVAVCTFVVAVDRSYKSGDGERKADFINCVSWRKTGEFIAKYFKKGSRIAITGSLQSRSFDDKDGKKVYVTEVVVDDAEFVDLKKENEYEQPNINKGVPSSSGDKINSYLPKADEEPEFGMPFDL